MTAHPADTGGVCPPMPADQTVCVTGGRGSLGRRLVRRLREAGVRRVVTLARQPAVAVADPGVRHVTGDVRDAASLDLAFAGCSVVFHLAGLKTAASAPADAARYDEVNAAGTLRVLEACDRHGVSRLVFASTAYVYGPPLSCPITESHPTAPTNAYGASKLAAERAIQDVDAAGSLIRRIARCSNIYGASIEPETVAGLALQQAAAGGPIQLRDLRPVRDFLHVDDAVAGLMALAGGADRDAHEPCRVVNLSTGRGTSIAELVETLARVAEQQGFGRLVVRETVARDVDSGPAIVLDNTRLRLSTGWQPHVDLEEGLRRALSDIHATRQVAS